MGFKKNQKKYNKEVMQTGLRANKYLQANLNLLNKYTTGYADRTDFWTNKLNDRQLNLLSDKYLRQNADMLRGQAAFGSNSQLNQQINDNAYTQQNYLANVANQNVRDANQLQNNELSALNNASNIYHNVVQTGGSAAQNVDAANTALLGAIGKSMQSAGSVMQAIPTPWTQAIGGALNATGGLASGLSTESTSLSPGTLDLMGNNMANSAAGFSNWLGSGELAQRLGVFNKSSSSSLSNQLGFTMPSTGRLNAPNGFGSGSFGFPSLNKFN